jgi:hypothetical protein
MCVSLRVLFDATNTEFSRRSNKICVVSCRVLPVVVNGYCLIVFPEAKEFPSFTLFVTDLKPTARSEVIYN